MLADAFSNCGVRAAAAAVANDLLIAVLYEVYVVYVPDHQRTPSLPSWPSGEYGRQFLTDEPLVMARANAHVAPLSAVRYS